MAEEALFGHGRIVTCVVCSWENRHVCYANVLEAVRAALLGLRWDKARVR
jgi:hypothetical protein